MGTFSTVAVVLLSVTAAVFLLLFIKETMMLIICFSLLLCCAGRQGAPAASPGIPAQTPGTAAAVPPDARLELSPIILSDLSYLDPFLSREEIDILVGIKSVESFRLNPKENGSFHGFAVVGRQPTQLNETQVAYLRGILLNEENHVEYEVTRNCRFMPDIAFRCYGNDNAFVDIMVSFSCGNWQFVFGEKVYHNDCDNARESMSRLEKNIYGRK